MKSFKIDSIFKFYFQFIKFTQSDVESRRFKFPSREPTTSRIDYLIKNYKFIFNIMYSKIKAKAQNYSSTKITLFWNLLDISGCLIFIFAFIIRLNAGLTNNENKFIAARLVHPFYLRNFIIFI